MSTETNGVPRRVSHAQNGEDVRAWRALRHVESVFYVEVGASDPIVDSLSAALSAEGARGVLFEADPAAAQVLRDARPRDVVIAAAAHSAAGVLTFHQLDRRGWGSVAPSRVDQAQDHVVRSLTVPAIRVEDVLTDLAPEAVHFMSIDVEGHEESVLAGAGLARHRPWILCVEATEPNSRTQAWSAWEPGVLSAGYEFVAFDGLNRWYVAEEHSDLADAVAEPFGVLDRLLDGWVPADVAALEDRIAQRDADMAAVEAALAAAEERITRQSADLLEARAALEEAAAHAAESARRHADELKTHADELRTHADELRRVEEEAAAARAEVLAAQARAVAAENRAADSEGELARLGASKSWRYTRPMREVLHAVGSGRARTLPAQSRSSALRAANRALGRHPALRAALVHRLSAVPGLDERLRTWHVPPAQLSERAGSPAELHAVADARVRASIDTLIRSYRTASTAPQAG